MVQHVHLETSIISYLAARPSRDLITAARQQLTHEWWALRRSTFEICVSELVVAEAAAGDPDAAQSRAQIIRDIHPMNLWEGKLCHVPSPTNNPGRTRLSPKYAQRASNFSPLVATI
jgi:hypothetical protein